MSEELDTKERQMKRNEIIREIKKLRRSEQFQIYLYLQGMLDHYLQEEIRWMVEDEGNEE